MTDVGEYCRQVEAYLTRVNGGHLVRVVGPSFVMVRQWADEGIPLSAVYRGIDQKAERHRVGASKRPLRIEFCEADVREVFETWRRAIGVAASEPGGDVPVDVDVDRGSGPARRSTSRELGRAIERLVQIGGRLDLSEAFRDAANEGLDALSSLRDRIKGVRGEARAEMLTILPDLDARLLSAARAAAPAEVRRRLEVEAESDLAAYRGRLSAEAWQAAVAVTVDRGIRAHFQLPDLTEIGA